jgi:hypothetical protein
MGNKKDEHWRYNGPVFPIYEGLLIGIGFIAGMLACMIMAGH